MRIEKLIDESSIHFGKWTNTLNDFKEYAFEGNSENYSKYHDKVIESLYEIHLKFKEFAQVKDNWKPEMVSGHAYGLELHFKSIKTKNVYRFGFDYEGLYLSTYLINWGNLGLMKDEFWQIIHHLKDYGAVHPITSYFSKEDKKRYPEIFRNNTGLTYPLLRHYFLSKLVGSNHEGPELRLSWDKETYGINDVLKLGCQAFKELYRINYLLWKK